MGIWRIERFSYYANLISVPHPDPLKDPKNGTPPMFRGVPFLEPRGLLGGYIFGILYGVWVTATRQRIAFVCL